MSLEVHGQNLVFLISQPRAGSTLLQRMLGSHPEIETRSETWLMLPALLALRRRRRQPDDELAILPDALSEFVQSLPRGEADYFEGVRRMYAYLYGQALAGSGKRFYLDKTPRYYLVISELGRAFPEARFVFLLRNPLAVLVSILKTWTADNWLSLLGLYRFRRDLLAAPCLILDGAAQLGARATVARYENLVTDPEAEIRRLCAWLGVDFAAEMIEYGRQAGPAWRLGDLEQVHRHGRPVAALSGAWQSALRAPQVWRLARDYVERLDRSTLERMGYSPESLRQTLEHYRPNPIRLRLTVSLDWLLSQPRDPGRTWEKRMRRLQRRIGPRLPVRPGWAA